MPQRGSLGGVTGALRAMALAALVAGCAAAPPPAGPPPARPQPRVLPPAPPPASAASEAVRAHFARVQGDLLARGLLRTDGGGPDTPFGLRQLAENFVKIALYDEYLAVGGRLVARQTPSRLRRWQEPVRIGLRFGDSVPVAQRSTDRAAVTDYAARLSRLTGLSIRVTDRAPNFWVYIVSEDERPGLGVEWAGLFPGLVPRDLAPATQMGLATFCMVLAISEGDSPVYSGALAVIRSELPDRLRLSCIHEELAQGLGLANDSPAARPSIFNDDEEFALLTGHDELLLRILYDPALTPGMTEAEVRPLLGPIIARMAGPGS